MNTRPPRLLHAFYIYISLVPCCLAAVSLLFCLMYKNNSRNCLAFLSVPLCFLLSQYILTISMVISQRICSPFIIGLYFHTGVHLLLHIIFIYPKIAHHNRHNKITNNIKKTAILFNDFFLLRGWIVKGIF